MALFGNIKRHHEQHTAQVAEDHYRAALTTWQEADAHLQSLLDLARTFQGQSAAENPNLPLVLKRGERAYFTLTGAGLVESRRGQGHYIGGYSGFSFRVAKGIRYHVGGTRGHYEPGAEAPTMIDTGIASITDQRVVFQGAKQTREWPFAKLLGYQHFDAPPWTAIEVSNRQKTSGILCDNNTADLFQFRLALALAHNRGQVNEFVAGLNAQLDAHHAARPAEPQLPTNPT